MLKGFYFSGITFVAVFVLAASAAFFFSTAIRDSNDAIVREAQTTALLADVESDLLRFTSTVYEVVANNSVENNRTEMQRDASRALLRMWNLSVDVVFSNASSLNTNVSLVFRNYSLNNSHTIINLTGAEYSTIIGHGFFHFSHIFETFNSNELCSYVDFNPESEDYCSINVSGFASDKRRETGFAWPVNVTSGSCEDRQVNYAVRFVDPGDLASAVNPFQLRARNNGFQHLASC